MPVLIVVVGPTAVGKTAISIELAKVLKSSIISSDSRQFYREMTIGTAKPDKSQLADVQHYFVNNLSIDDIYSVGDFEREVLRFLETYFTQNNVALMVGGSGLYIDAVINGLDELPQVPEELRWKIMEEVESNGLATLVQELHDRDPLYYQTVDRNNTQRIVRAVEVCRHTGRPFSSFLKKTMKPRPFEVVKIGITAERERLYERINQRVDLMMEQGLLEEAKNLYPLKELYALQTVGYQELFDYFEGKTTLGTAVELIKRNTRRYAKRQLTWFRRDPAIQWFGNNELEKIKTYIREKLAQSA